MPKDDHWKKDAPSAASGTRGWRIAFLVACTVGVCLSADLIRLHVNVHTDPSYQSYCAISERVDCGAVALSNYAVFLGLPVAVWGLLGYLLMAALTVWSLVPGRRPSSWPFGILFWMAGFSTIIGVALFAISHFVIESICIVCATSYAVSLLLLWFAYMALRRSDSGPLLAAKREIASLKSEARRPIAFATVTALIVVAVWVAVPPYWRVEVSLGLPSGIDERGHPWIGAREPELTISEFSDYQCPHCQRGHAEIRELVETFTKRIRLVHRNYPLDNSCNPSIRRAFHPFACQYARMAFCAQRQGRFWEANDYLFQHGRDGTAISVSQLAGELGLDESELAQCVAGEDAAEAVRADLNAGRQLGIRGTPTYVLDGTTYPGRIPPEILRRALGIEQPQQQLEPDGTVQSPNPAPAKEAAALGE